MQPIASFRVDELLRSPRVHASTWQASEGGSPRFPSAAHVGVELAWCVEGSVVYEVGSRTLELAPGQVVVIPEGVEHRTRLLGGARATSLKLDAVLVAEAASEVGAAEVEPGLMPLTDVLARLGSMMAAPGPRRAREAPVDDVAQAFVRNVLQPSGERSVGRDPRIRRVLRWAEERISEPLEVADLARAAAMSRFHFSRSFRAELGISPYQWLLQRRVEQAAALLRRERVSVTEAAFAVGFGDLSRFARAFREQFGCPPSAFAA